MSIFDQIKADAEAGTPGPWEIGNLESWEGFSGVAFRRVYFPSKSDEDIHEAHVRGEDCDANARRIARVPELERMVLEMKDTLENIVIAYGMGWDLGDLIDAARSRMEDTP